jgi:rhamnosyltransferase
MKSNKVICVIVTYNPRKSFLLALNSIISQEKIVQVIIIDNSENLTLNLNIKNEKVRIIKQGENVGIARAQNIGIIEAMNSNPRFILLSDQDTIFPDNYVEELISQTNNFNGLAALAPAFIDLNKKDPQVTFIGESKWHFPKIKNPIKTVRISQAIASGMLLCTDNLKRIGLMDESLFIDFVDLEWCWRATNMGFKIIGVPTAKIQHTLGDKSINIGIKEVPVRNHIRHYYMTRNALHLGLRDQSLNISKKFLIFSKAIQYSIILPLLTKTIFEGYKFSFLAVKHGLTGRLGKLITK